MGYKTANAFRKALEARLLNRSRETGEPLLRLRKRAAFDRFLARLFPTQRDEWLLKGGVAMQLRFVEQARTTKDIDLLSRNPDDDLLKKLRDAGSVDLGDWFRFEIEEPTTAREGFGGIRFRVSVFLAGRSFTVFPLDVGVGDPVIGNPEWLESGDLFVFAGFGRVRIPAYSIPQQIAEKFHAYTMEYSSGSSSRVKDLFDILLLTGYGEISGKELSQALELIFEIRGSHDLPEMVPSPPENWRMPFEEMAGQSNLEYGTISSAYQALQNFFDPLLGNEGVSVWDPEGKTWR